MLSIAAVCRSAATLIMAAAVTVCGPPIVASASEPIAGGHYAGHAGARGARLQVNLTLANDGKEFANFSYIEAYGACGSDSYDFLSLDGHIHSPAVRVRPDGTFRYRSTGAEGTKGTVRGRFRGDGRVVVGSVRMRSHGCRLLRAEFRARLVGVPNAPHPGGVSICDRVVVADADVLPEEVYRVLDHDLGCTAARELARRFSATTTCKTLPATAACTIPGAVCQSIRGSRYNALNSVRCTAGEPQRFTELRHYEPCAFPGDASVSLWSINIGCASATAFSVNDVLGDGDTGTGPCGDVFDLEQPRRCAIAGFTCTVRAKTFGEFGGFHALCVRDTDHFLALAIDYEAG